MGQAARQSFPGLTAVMGAALKVENAILDGEIVSLGKDGAPLFYDLTRRRAPHGVRP